MGCVIGKDLPISWQEIGVFNAKLAKTFVTTKFITGFSHLSLLLI